jgi:hypothetical protein
MPLSPKEATMSDERWTVDRYLKADTTDPHLWASLSLGDWQNLFEEALERMQEAEAEVERLRMAIWEAADDCYPENIDYIVAGLRAALNERRQR